MYHLNHNVFHKEEFKEIPLLSLQVETWLANILFGNTKVKTQTSNKANTNFKSRINK